MAPGDATASGFRKLATSLMRIARFGLVSLIGLGLDTSLFLGLVALGWRAGLANLLSAGAAVTFVYFTSARRIFEYAGGFLLPLFGVYMAYQVVAVLAASWAVDALTQADLAPLVAKLAILPVTFTANYVAMRLITRAR